MNIEDQKVFSHKVLLIKPGYRFFPIGFAYVMATLERHGIPFDFIDFPFEKINLRDILKRNRYLAVATGGLVGNFHFFIEISKQIKQSGNSLPFIMGGNITQCVEPDILFDRLGVDFAVLGEAETAFPGLLHRLEEDGKSFDDLPGIMFKDRKTGSILRKGPIRFNLDSDDIEPAWHNINMNYYLNRYHYFFCGRSFFPIMTGRGCTGHCSFCSPTIGRFKARKIDNILHEMWKVSSEYKFELFGVMTEVLFASTQEIIEFCKRYKEEGPKKEWFCSLRVDVDPVVLNTMKEAGCIGVSIGAESGSDKILKLMRKGINRNKIKVFVEEIKRIQMPLECNVMVGSEGETQEDLKETFDLLIEEEIFSNINLTIAYPGTLIYRHAKEKGLIHDEFEHILNEKYLELADDNIAESNYLNVSSFPTTEEMHNGIMEEVRRYLNFMLKRFPCKCQMNVDRNTDGIMIEIRRYLTFVGDHNLTQLQMYADRSTPIFSAQCSVCGMKSEISQPSGNWKWDGLAIRLSCPKCFNVSFSWIGSKDFIAMVGKGLNEADRILVFGVGMNAKSILAFGLDGLDMRKIIGFVDPLAKTIVRSKFFSYTLYKLSEIKKLNPDVVLITDTNFPNAWKMIKSIDADNKAKLIPLMPDVFPVNLLKDKRILFIGADSSLSYVLGNLMAIEGCKICGAIGCKQGLEKECSEIKILPATTLFSKDWDVAINLSGGKLSNALLWFLIKTTTFSGRKRIIMGRGLHPFLSVCLWMPVTPTKILLDLIRILFSKTL